MIKLPTSIDNIIELQKGDLIVFQIREMLPDSELQRVTDYIEERMPPTMKYILINGKAMDISVLREKGEDDPATD